MNKFQADLSLEKMKFTPSEVKHHYGENIHLLADPHLLSLLAKICSPDTHQPLVNELMMRLYANLLTTVMNQEFKVVPCQMPTRMMSTHPEGVYTGPIFDPAQKIVSVNLARAGTLPSHVCYTTLNYLLDPANVRQDHISIARQTGDRQQVTGSEVSGHKIGGPVDQSIILFPDPMGATGGTICKAMEHYKAFGKAYKYISMHCIVTPEYLKLLKEQYPEVIIYAVRLDRGLSPQDVLKTVPGTHWEKEKGLNDHQYIVPGGGGLGEIMNNAFV